jgi:hypothetical protein
MTRVFVKTKVKLPSWLANQYVRQLHLFQWCSTNEGVPTAKHFQPLPIEEDFEFEGWLREGEVCVYPSALYKTHPFSEKDRAMRTQYVMATPG